MIVLYNHPALPPKGIKVGIPYDATFEGDEFIVDGIKFNKDMFYLLFKEIKEENVVKLNEKIAEENVEEIK